MWKSALPVVLGLGLLAGASVGAQAQTYPYYYSGYPAWQICPNTVYSNGYGSPHYYPYCGIEFNPLEISPIRIVGTDRIRRVSDRSPALDADILSP